MPSPAAAAAEDHHAMFGDEVEEEDDDSEMEMDEDSEEFDEEPPATAPPSQEEDLNSSPSSSTDDDDRLQNPSNGITTNNNNSAIPSDTPKQQISVSVSASHNGIQIQPSPTSAPFPVVSGERFQTPDPKRLKLEEGVVASEERKAAASLEDSRRLFQRLWTDEDEIKILQGFYEFTSQRGTTHHAHQHDTGPFYDQIRTKLQLDFNKNQLVEKLRRLKKKYRNVINRMGSGKDFVFKSAHDQATFEISRKIWSNSVARGVGHYDQDDDDGNDGEHHGFDKQAQKVRRRGRKRSATLAAVAAAAGSEAVAVEVKAVPTLTTTTSGAAVVPTAVCTPAMVTPTVVEEAMRSCLSPLFKEMLQSAVGSSSSPLGSGIGGGSPFALSMMPLGFVGNSGGNLAGSVPKEGEVGDKWRKQQILELEVYSKRLELVQEQIKFTLEELRSSGC